MNAKRRHAALGSQAVVLAGTSALAQVLTAVMYIVAARRLGPDGLSGVVAPVSTGVALVGLADFGANSLWLRKRARGDMDGASLGGHIVSKLALVTAIVAVSMVAALILGLPHNWLVAGPVLVSQLAVQTMQVPPRAAGHAWTAASVVLCGRLVALGLLGALMTTGLSAATSLWLALCAADALSAVALGPLSVWRLGLRFGRPVWWPWRGSFHFGVSSLAVSAAGFDVGLLAIAGGASAAGHYGAVNRWVQPFNLVSASISLTILPSVSRASGVLEAWRVAKPLRRLVLIAAAAALLLFGVSGWLVPFLLGPSFAGSIGILQLLALGSALTVFNQPLSAALQSLGHERLVSAIRPAITVLRLGTVLLLGSQLGGAAAAGSYAIGELAILGFLGTATMRFARAER